MSLPFERRPIWSQRSVYGAWQAAYAEHSLYDIDILLTNRRPPILQTINTITRPSLCGSDMGGRLFQVPVVVSMSLIPN